MTTYTVYKAESKDGHVYVGMTSLSLKKRIKSHRDDAARGKQLQNIYPRRTRRARLHAKAVARRVRSISI